MSIAWQILWFIVAVSLLVTVHEYGHYWVARRLGFKVLRFSVGFGKPLWKRVAGPDQTEYVVAALPLGGYVKMLDEREGPVDPADLARSFTRKPPWQRIAVLLAGPAFNIAFAILVLWGMFWVTGISELRPRLGTITPASPAAAAGLRSGDEVLSINGKAVTGQSGVVFGLLDAMSTEGRAVLQVRDSGGAVRPAVIDVPDEEQRLRLTEPAELFRGIGLRFWEPFALPRLGPVTADGPAARAGLKEGDVILSVDGRAYSFREVGDAIAAKHGESLLIRYRRGDGENSVRVTPVAQTEAGKTVGRIQVALGPEVGVRYPESMRLHQDLGPVSALRHAVVEAWDKTALQARLVWRMLLGDVSVKNLSGPLSIAEFAGESATYGVASFLSFLVLISLSLGFLNLLPIPLLDGGQIVFQLAEWLKGSPLSERVQIFGQQVGIALLVLLTGVALFNDIVRQLN
jgi:regulator of sigma E protease